MAINFAFWGKVVPPNEEEPEKPSRLIMSDELKEEYQLGPAMISFHSKTEVLNGKYVQLRPGAFSEEEYQAIMNGEPLLDTASYGRTWRAWDGKPLQEQMIGTEWER